MNWLDAFVGASEIVSSHWPPKQQQPQPWMPGKPSIDIVIPHCGDKIVTSLGHMRLSKPMSAGLLMTLMTCEEALKGTNLNYRYVVVANGVAKNGEEREALNEASKFLEQTGRGKVIEVEHGISPGAARTLGASAGSGDLIFFFDNHCYVHKRFFTSAVRTFESMNADAVHGVTRYGGKHLLHYNLSLENGFYGQPSEFPSPKALVGTLIHCAMSNDGCIPSYRIVSAGHGAFAIKRSVWNEVGGYWDGFEGFGGEETYFDLKLALMDKTIWLDPNMTHEHFEGGQKAYKVWPRFCENTLMTANIIGGPRWAETNAASFHARNILEGGESKQYYDTMLSRAIERSEDHAKWFASKRLRTLDEQLAKFKAEGVAM